MNHGEFEGEYDVDRALSGAYERFDAVLSGRTRDTVAQCYAIIDPYTASQIRTAAHRAEFAGPEFDTWTRLARERAGYGAHDFAGDPR